MRVAGGRLLPGFLEIADGLVGDARFHKMPRQLHCNLVGLVGVQGFQHQTHVLVQVGALRLGQFVVQVGLEQVVLELVLG